MNENPVFVAGLERTGTSLMFALLASHPNISMTRRTNYWRYFADQYGDLADDANLDACLDKMRVYKRMIALDLDFAAIRDQFVAGPRTYGRLYVLMERQIADRRGKPRWGDKSLNIERYADRLIAEYPDARILHMIRDPRDRLASVLARWKSRRAGVGVGTASWLWSANLAIENARRHPDNYRIVRYESLVSDPEEEIRSVCDFIGEPYDPDMLAMGGAERFRDDGANSSYGARPIGVISTDSIGKYAKVLQPREVMFMQEAARAPMATHGYDLQAIELSPAERVRLKLTDRPYNRVVMAAWRRREAADNKRGRPLPEYRMVPEAVAAGTDQ